MDIVQVSRFDGKVCRTCGEWKPLTAYYSNGTKGADCKECEKARKRAKWAADPESARKHSRAYRVSNPQKVKEWKRVEWERHGDRYKEQRRQHRRENPEHYRQLEQRKRQRNGEKIRNQRRRRYALSPEKHSERARIYRVTRRHWLRQYARKYYRQNRDYWKAKNHQRKALLKGGGEYSPTEWRRLCDWFGGICLACGERSELTVDHVIPISKGGSNTIDNLQPLCGTCNNTKKTKTIDYRPRECLIAFLETL
jgi:5-methylcytosine-specific restriction endonuclease McrA